MTELPLVSITTLLEEVYDRFFVQDKQVDGYVWRRYYDVLPRRSNDDLGHIRTVTMTKKGPKVRKDEDGEERMEGLAGVNSSTRGRKVNDVWIASPEHAVLNCLLICRRRERGSSALLRLSLYNA